MKPTYKEFLAQLSAALGGRADLVPYARVVYEAPDPLPYDLMCIRDIGTGPVLIIRATIHGDEPGGALTLMRHVGHIIDYARERGVSTVIYPMDNPSGYEAGTRYNIEGDRGSAGNNDCLRYRLADGTLTDDIGDSDDFVSWHWSSDPAIGERLPKESAALLADLKTLRLERVRGVVDIHQDPFVTRAGAYHYAFGNVSRYRSIIDAIDQVAHVFRNDRIDSGYAAPSTDRYHPVSDDQGFICRHDGSLPDLFWRLGAPHAITVETTTQLPREVVDEVNLAWVRGIIDRVSEER